MKKELDYFNIEELYGGNQEIFSDLWMRGGGCAAVTACDLSIYLDLYKGTGDAAQGLYPFDLQHLTKESYERFAMLMKPYLRPRFSGIDKLDIYLKGYGKYLADRGCGKITLSGFSGEEPYDRARELLISQIDAGFPVPMLNLRHRDKTFSDFEWHWFLLTGYETFEDTVMVKVVSYGEFVWFDFKVLWHTGYRQKGGLIIVSDASAPAKQENAGETDQELDDEIDEVKFGLSDEYIYEKFAALSRIDSLSHREREIADYIKAELNSMGITAEEDNAGALTGGNAGNLYAFVKGNIEGAPILLSAHMDTVVPGIGKKPVWNRENGTITSDGTTVLGSDDAAGILEILEALRVMTARELPHRDLEILFTVAEEVYGDGASVFDYSRLRTDEAYILDSSGPVGKAVYQAPSIISFEAEITGRAAHAGFEPEKGIHAVDLMCRAVASVRQGRIDEETTCNIGMISGGNATNIVPASCICRGEIRSLSHEKALRSLEETAEIFRKTAADGGAELALQHKIHIRAYETDLNTPAAKHFSEACGMLEREPEFVQTFGGSDNNCFAEHGIPGLVLSCGMQNVHTVDEFIRIADIRDSVMLILCLAIQE